jgi:hypothetical protein
MVVDEFEPDRPTSGARLAGVHACMRVGRDFPVQLRNVFSSP